MGPVIWVPNAFITPRVAASTPISLPTAAEFVREQARRFLAGEPLGNVITGEY
ncbi:MAG TPA: hypothetical protein VH480_22475 [Streptosporangiaceae bacterium]|jgi:phosphoglycerate dehydrogenase-like enzyme